MIGIGSRAFLLSFLIVFAAGSQTPISSTYSVIYTGRLFGYFRYPEVQRKADTGGCPDPKAFQFGEAVESFGTVSRSLPEIGTTVRVAVGDNFAPFLLAREMRDPTGPFVGKDESVTSPAKPGFLPRGCRTIRSSAIRPQPSGSAAATAKSPTITSAASCADAIRRHCPRQARFLLRPRAPAPTRAFPLEARTQIQARRHTGRESYYRHKSSHPRPAPARRPGPSPGLPARGTQRLQRERRLPSTPLPFLRETRIQNVLKICEIRTSSGALYTDYSENLLGRAVPTPAGFAALVNLLGPGRGMGAIAPIEAQMDGATYTLLVERRVQTVDICRAKSGHLNVLTTDPCIALLPMLSPDDRLDTTSAIAYPIRRTWPKALRFPTLYLQAATMPSVTASPIHRPGAIDCPFASPSRYIRRSSPIPTKPLQPAIRRPL